MNPKEALQQIRALFEDMPQVVEPVAPVAPVAPEVTKVEMAEYSLVDGTKVMISALEIGGMVEMADGTPAPAGEHQLMDGTSIQVDELGTIVEISSPKEDVIVEEPVAPAAPVVPAQDTTAMAEELKAEFAAQKSQLEEKIAELESKVKQGFAQVAELVEALSNTPTAEPTQKAANAFQSYVTTNDSKYERLEKYRNAILNK
jgi:tetrahydromethanopterin S-methyltransferase subunit B